MTKKIQLLYLIKAGENYKIGISTDINRRIQGLQTASPFKVICVAYYKTEESARKVESQLHTLFKQYRLEGEWFDFKGKFTQEAFDTICPRYGMTKLEFLEDGSCQVMEEPKKEPKPFGRVPDSTPTKHKTTSVEGWRKYYGIKRKS